MIGSAWLILISLILVPCPQGERNAENLLPPLDLPQALERAAELESDALDELIRAEKPRISQALQEMLLAYLDRRLEQKSNEAESLLSVARKVAHAYERLFQSSVLVERCSLFASWSMEDLAKRQACARALDQARNALSARDPQRAGAILQEPSGKMKRLGDRHGLARIALLQAQIDYALRNTDGLTHAREARALFETEDDSIGAIQTMLAEADLLRINQDTAEALARLEEAIALSHRLNDRPLEGDAYIKLGRLHFFCSRLGPALKAYRRALDLFETLNNAPRMTVCLNNLGAICVEQGRYQEAIRYLHRSGTLAEQTGNPLYAAAGYANAAALYIELNDYERALDGLYRARKIYEENSVEGEPFAHVLHNIAVCRQKEGELEAACAAFEELLSIRRSLNDRSGEAMALLKKGEILGDLGRDDEALKTLNQALTLFESLEDDHGLGLALSFMGNLCLNTERYDEARDYLEKAMDPAGKCSALHLEASILRKTGLYHYQTGDLLSCVRLYEEAFDLLESLGETITPTSLKIGLQHEAHKLIAPYLHALLMLHQQNPRGGYPQRAFAWIEKWKSGALLDMIGNDRRILTKDAPQEAREKEADLLRKLGVEVAEMRRLDPGAPARTEAKDRITGIQCALEEVREKIALSCPAYQDLTSGRSFSAAGIQAEALDEDTLLLEYKLSEKSSYLFALTRKDFKLFALPAVEEIERKVEYALNMLNLSSPAHVPAEEYAAVLHGLYKTLLAPVLNDPLLNRESLIIVPDGILASLPFEALVMQEQEAGAAGFEKTAFVLLTKRVLYAPSASVCVKLSGMKDRVKKDKSTPTLLAMANPDAGEHGAEPGFRTRDLREIPAALGEIKAVAALFPGCSVFINDQATEERLKSPGALDGHRIVHIAAHGIFNANEPRLSGLMLKSDPEGDEDGFLMMTEVLSLPVTADLVVLSACHTALGERAGGEGVIGLPWAFLYAGARSVVVSLWAVDDASTARLMQSFYKNLTRKRLDKAESLRQAKIAVLKNGSPAPQYWAPFILIGDGGALK